VPFKTALCYDPMTGKGNTLAVRQLNNQSYAYLQLEPGQSIILCCDNKPFDVAARKYLQSAGDAVMLQGVWQVEFIDGEPKLPKAYRTKTLESWTESPDPAADAFAGTARYTLTFNRPEKDADDWVLDLGDVRQSARIKVNGKNAGVLFAIPFRMRIGSLLKPGANTLEIEVTNLAANRIAALEKSGKNWKIMRDINIVNMNYKHFDPASWPIEASGLLGPVRLLPMQDKQVINSN